MNKSWLQRTTPIEVIALIFIAYFWGILTVPFHPDESTQLYMSGDLERFFTNPADLFWTPAENGGLPERYRLLDAPLTRLLIGLGRIPFGEKPLATDWDWSKNWADNVDSGAEPGIHLMLVGRLSVIWLFPLMLWTTYQGGKAAGGQRLGWLTLAFMATNALVLLHTRRAMAESALLFATTLFIWLALRDKTPAWLLGLSAALAFCAKQSAVVLLPVGLLAILWPGPGSHRFTLRRQVLRLGTYLAAFTLLVVLFNPWLWRHPIPAVRAALAARQELAARQTAEMRVANADQALDTPGERLVGTLAQLYFAPPAIWDVGNYTDTLERRADRYLSNPLNKLLRSFIGGGVLLTLTLLGIVLALVGIIRLPEQRRSLLLILTGFGLQLGFQIGFVTLPFQRYVIPLLPWTGLLMGYALARAIQLGRRQQ